MKSTLEIREDLKDIRYYYSRKDMFEKASQSIGKNTIYEKVEMYNNLICLAPPKLYDIYVSLYLNNNTQDSLADKLGYTIEHISRLNSQLVKFLHSSLEKEEVV